MTFSGNTFVPDITLTRPLCA